MFTKNHLMLILFVLIGSALFGQRINFTECGTTYNYTVTGGSGTNINSNLTRDWNLSGLGDYTVNIPTGAGWYYTVLGDGYGITGNFTNFGQTGTFHFSIIKPLTFGGGDGSEGNPYKVANPTHLDSVRNHLDSYFIQTADINLNVVPYSAGEGWVPIGDNTTPFEGSYNGNGFKIQNLYINDPAGMYKGLFGYINGGNLENIKLVDANITGSNYTGCLTGYQSGGSNHMCSSSGTVQGGSSVGGLIGYCQTLVDSAYSDTAVTGGSYTGGLIGYCHGEIKGSAAKGNVTGDFYIGGLAGFVHYGVTDSYSAGDVEGSENVGGLTGSTNGGAGSWIIRSYSAGQVTGETNTGGLTGFHDPVVTVTGSFYDSETSNMSDTGWGEPRTTAEMMTQSTFSGWDFSSPFWKIVDSKIYPYFAWEPISAISFSVNPAGSGTTNGVSDDYPIGTSLNLVATSNPYSSFINWTDNHKTVLSTDSAFTYTVTEVNTDLTANFTVLPDPVISILKTGSFALITGQLNSIDTGYNSQPCFADIDGNGLLDMLLGNTDGNIDHYEQDTVNSMNFNLITLDFNSIDAGSYIAPTITDLDGDGLFDLMIGEWNGYIRHYEQNSLNSTSFTLRTNTFNTIDVGTYSSPEFADLDGDGLLELLVGDVNGNIVLYKQNSLNSTSFTLVTTGFNSIDAESYSSPVVYDIDGDGLLDLLIGNYNGNIYHYEQDAANSLTFNFITVLFDTIDVGYKATPVITDLDNDGLVDMFSGNGDGYVLLYEQTVSGIGSMDFGNIAIGQKVTKNYILEAVNLRGDLQINCPSGYKVSLTGEAGFSQNLNITPANGNVSSKIYVKFEPEIPGSYPGDIAHASVDAETVNLSVTGSGYFSIPQNITITIVGTDLLLSWDAVPGATSYKVYSSNDPYGTFAEDTGGTLVGETWTLSYTESRKFYYVVAVDGAKAVQRTIEVNRPSLR